MTQFSPSLEMVIPGRPDCLSDVRQAVRRVSREIGFDDRQAGEVAMAIDEAICNIIKHGYGGPCEKEIELRMVSLVDDGKDGLEVTIRDYGKPVDPERLQGRNLEDVRPGGLGLHIMRTIMDDVIFQAAEGGGTLLTMRKRISA